MSQENVEIVRGMYDAFNRGDADAAGAPLHPEVELHQAPDMPDTDVYYGLEEFRRGFVQWLSAWEGFRFDPEEILDAGDSVLMRVRLSGRAKASGVQMELQLHHVWDFEDSKARRVKIFRTREEALEAAGLSEQPMSQENVEVVRNPLSVRERAGRTLDQRLALRLPRLVAASARLIGSLPPGSRLRQAALRRAARLAAEALNRRDIDVILLGYDPDYEFHPAREFVDGGLMPPCYRGPAGYHEFVSDGPSFAAPISDWSRSN